MSYTQKKKKKEGKNSTFNPRTIPIISEFWKRVSPNSSRYDWLHIMIAENLFRGPTQLFHPLKSYILLHYAFWISMPYKGVCTLHLAPSLHDQTFHASPITLRAWSLEEPKDSRKSLKIIEQRSWDFGMHQNISDCLFFFLHLQHQLRRSLPLSQADQRSKSPAKLIRKEGCCLQRS